MKLPEGVNPVAFYQQCKAKGIKITSRFPGVYFVIHHGKLVWKASLDHKGKNHSIGYYPFTLAGEREAGGAIEKLRLELGKAPIQKIKPRQANT